VNDINLEKQILAINLHEIYYEALKSSSTGILRNWTVSSIYVVTTDLH